MRLLLGAAGAVVLWSLAMSVRDEAGRMVDSRGKVMDEKVDVGYSDSWVVEMDVDEKEADVVAESHGFINLGQVGNLKHVYHFALKPSDSEAAATKQDQEGKVLPRRGTSMVSKMPDKTAELNSDERVRISMQQRAYRKEPRSFSYPSDPLWENQWSLYNYFYGSKGNDLNVVPAWIQGYTGKGVVVTVVDDGLQTSHPDLSDNYDSYASYNFVETKNDPSPTSPYDTHGTSCAGEVGMSRDNNYCGAGVAYNCKLGGVRIDLSYLLDVTESQALSYKDDYIHVYSNSWGPPDNGFLVQGPGFYSGRTLKQGVTSGRGGLGSIWTWASGNGGRNYDSCAADGYASSIYTIAVGSAEPNGKQAYYDEDCSGKMAVTYSYSSKRYFQLISTSTQGRCTTSFTGTSASAPLMAGVIALVLEANPNLTWRDVQYLIAYTSDPTPFSDASSWSKNGAGRSFSNQYGFGAVDAEAMVTRATHWTNVPDQRTCTFTPSSNNNAYATKDNSVSVQFSVSSDCGVQYLEHVVVEMSLSITVQNGKYYSYNDYFSDQQVLYHDGARRGDISVELFSPSGTRSVLLPERKNDYVNDEGYSSWPFMSVQYWGEHPVGDWTVNVYFSSDSGYITVADPTVVLYGTEEVPESIRRIPDQCSSECLRGCASQGEQYCDSCKQRRMASSLKCVSSCPGESAKLYDGTDVNGTSDSDDACTMNGYCLDCGGRFLLLSLPIIALIVVSGIVVILGTFFVVFVLWSKFYKSRSHDKYVKL